MRLLQNQYWYRDRLINGYKQGRIQEFWKGGCSPSLTNAEGAKPGAGGGGLGNETQNAK